MGCELRRSQKGGEEEKRPRREKGWQRCWAAPPVANKRGEEQQREQTAEGSEANATKTRGHIKDDKILQ